MERAPHRIDRHGDLPVAARNATLGDLADILKTQQARKLDVVAPATAIRSQAGTWLIDGTDPVLDDDGVTNTAGRYRPTDQADGHLAEKLGIPRAYLRRLRAERADLYDANVNGWLHGTIEPVEPAPIPDDMPEPMRSRLSDVLDGAQPTPDDRSFMVRCFRGDTGDGIARALLSDRYRIVDHLDVLTAALTGVRAAGGDVQVDTADLTDRKMTVRFTAPQIGALAPDLLDGYRSPFTGAEGADNPLIFAGLVLSNSETGGGAFSLTPQLIVEVCRNGMTMKRDALRSVHVGGQLDDGVVRWSEDTQRRNLDLVTAQTRDAVTTFLDVDYVRAKIDELSGRWNAPVDRPEETVRTVVSQLRFGEAAADAILGHFIAGGQPTAGGVVQAVTSYAQTVDDPDAASDLEAAAVDVLALAAA